MSFNSWARISRTYWGNDLDDSNEGLQISLDKLKIGCLQRIAAALESIAESVSVEGRAEQKKVAKYKAQCEAENDKLRKNVRAWNSAFWHPAYEKLTKKIEDAGITKIGHMYVHDMVRKLLKGFSYPDDGKDITDFAESFDPLTFNFETLSRSTRYREDWEKKKKELADANRRTRDHNGLDSPSQESTHPAEGNR